ncbi:protein MpPPR_17 [Marchantia polymorpha subsp. ruderalis]|uniref:Pentacotripeptide-repeat region of PRORP domain-containing protein n=2 Tax=Marchantia polymorpha TaxID=3197 RepID=A0AAF6BCZ6_MARPO|nr:hypothetical protein MARPO_0020s0110 [Marchantia polymorpha]BBN09880.1 hypothetical protein Mp_4g23470 [Marchantia polymorpha subsp. ruderalis]|eukprot:PTQ44457.1 hypothetical protein MARPO_0020s0110 [Marchantia polymorpha]
MIHEVEAFMARVIVASRDSDKLYQIHRRLWEGIHISRILVPGPAGLCHRDLSTNHRVVPPPSFTRDVHVEDLHSFQSRARNSCCFLEPEILGRFSRFPHSLQPYIVDTDGFEDDDQQFLHRPAAGTHSCRSSCGKTGNYEIPTLQGGVEVYSIKTRHSHKFQKESRSGSRRLEFLTSPSLWRESHKSHMASTSLRTLNLSAFRLDLRVAHDLTPFSRIMFRGFHFAKGPSKIGTEKYHSALTSVQGISDCSRKNMSEAKREEPASRIEKGAAIDEQEPDKGLHLGREDEDRTDQYANAILPPPMGSSRLAKKIKYILGGGAGSWHALSSFRMNLNPSLVSKVLKVVEDFRLAYGFFKWAGEQQGYENTADVYNIMVGKLAVNGHVEGAVLLLEEMTSKDLKVSVVTYTTVIHALCKAGDINAALKLFSEMRTSLCAPNVYTYNAVMNGLGKMGRVDEALKLFADMKSTGCSPDVVTFNTLIDALGRSGDMNKAGQLFQEMEATGCTPDVVTYNSLIHGFGKEGRCSAACAVFEGMKRNGCAPDTVTYNTLMDALAKGQMWDLAFELLEEFQKESRFAPGAGAALYTSLIDALCKAKLGKEGFRVFESMQQHGSTPDLYTYTTLLVGLGKSGQWDLVRTVVADVKRAGYTLNVVTYNSLIDSLGKAGQDEAARRLFAEMEQSGVSPDVVTYNSLIAGIGKVGSLEEALELLETMKTRGISPTVVTYTSLIDLHIKAGNIKVVWKLLEEMNLKGLKPNAVTYRALIDGFCKAGELELAWDFYLNMLDMDYPPHLFTYKSLITACHKEGRADKMQELFENIKQKSYGRKAGQLGTLEEFLRDLEQSSEGRRSRKGDLLQQGISK